MTNAIEHRGPDSDGFFYGPNCHLGVRRLKVIDPQGGDQPIFSETRDKCIAFNGEIYNHHDLRIQLTHLGHRFRTRSDTEVALNAYEEWGQACLNHLNGMFAMAIADSDSVFLARDRLGLKPLYYTHLSSEDLFLFASEIKALLCHEQLSLSLNSQGLGDMLVLGYPVGEESLFTEVRRLLPGSWMRLRWTPTGLVCTGSAYFNLCLDPNSGIGFEEAEELLYAATRAAVTSHVVADVPVGSTLSGGLDSSMLTMLMREQTAQATIKTFTIADASDSTDLLVARRFARTLESQHQEHIPSFDECLRMIPGCIRTIETPLLGALPFYILCSQIGGRVKVALNGEGADELLGGYPEYLDSTWMLLKMQNGLMRARDLQLPVSEVVLAFVDRLSKAGNFEERLAAIFDLNLADQLARHHLDVIDKCSMAFGIEMRVPFLDDALVEVVRHFPHSFKVDAELSVGKYILRTTALKYMGSAMVGVALRPKHMMPHACQNFLGGFARLCAESLPFDYVDRHDLNTATSGRARSGWAASKTELATFDLFRYIFLENRGAVPPGFDIVSFLKNLGGRQLGAN